MKYKHLFFDLDKTLWDFKRNSEETLLELFDNYQLKNIGVEDSKKFIDVYTEINEKQWADYRAGRVNKEKMRAERFIKTFDVFQVSNDSLAQQLSDDYLEQCPEKTYLFPQTVEVLDYLSGKYLLHIITNGFEEVQHRKMNNCDITKYFTEIITSEKSGFLKPNPQIFFHALETTGAVEEESIMIGDSLEVDILGAREAGIDQIYFNPDRIEHSEKVTFEIHHLSALTNIL